MADIQTLVKLITDFGIMIIIVGIFLYVVIRLINIWLSKYESTSNAKKHDKLIDIRSNVGKEIQKLIEDYLYKTEGNRVHVIEFSNSVMSVAYLPFRYMTCTYEVYKFGKAPTGHTIDRISTSLFTKFFEILQENEYYVVNCKKSSAGGAVADLVESQDEHQSLCTLLKTPKGKNIGYIKLSKDEEFTEEDKQGILELANKVSTLLSVVDR